MRATYSPEDNKLRIYPAGTRVDSLLDETEYAEFKAVGYKWASKQECFVAARWTPAAEDWALELADEIEDEDYSPEERSADRAERFETYREKRADEAGGHADTFEAGPSAFGHQNRGRAERQARRHDRHRGRAVTQWSKAEYWTSRTAGVISHALHRSSAHVRRGRILTLESEQRKHEASRAEYAERYAKWQKVLTLPGTDMPVVQDKGAYGIDALATSDAGRLAYALANNYCWGDYKHPRKDRTASMYSLLTDAEDPITAGEAATLWLAGHSELGPSRWSAHYELRLTYERAMLENEGGTAAAVEMEVGGFIRARNRTGSVFTDVPGGWMQIHGINKSPATGRVTSVKVMGLIGIQNPKPGLVSINIERLGEDAYRAPTDEEREAFKTATKERKAKEKAVKPTVPPLINPTDADAERLQAIWNAHEKELFDLKKRYEEFQPSTVLRLTQAEYSAYSKGTHSSYETIDVSEQLRRRRSTAMQQDRTGRVTVFKIRKAPSPGSSWYRADRVIVLTDKPQKPIPWELVDEMRAEQPTEESMFPQLEEIQRACSAHWLPESGTPDRNLIEDAAYLGWTHVSSMSQFGFTDEGREVLKRFQALKAEGCTPIPTGFLFSLESVAAARAS